MGYKVFLFIWEVRNRVIKNNLLIYANSLTFKLILSIFPFLIALLALLGFLNLPAEDIISTVSNEMPKDISNMISYFIYDVLGQKRLSLLSSSVIIAVYSASAGFHTMIKAISDTFEVNENRDFIKTRIISLCLMLVFIVIIVVTLYILIFGNVINNLIENLGIIDHIPSIITGTIMHIAAAFVVTVFLILLYKFAVNFHIKTKRLLPGIVFTILSWFVISKLFNVYISNFSKYSVVYGSIGVIFVFALWLYLLSCLILIGAQINAVLYDKKFMNSLNSVKGVGVGNDFH